MEISELKSKMPTEDVINSTAELFKVLGDATRTKILTVLEYQELRVTDICSCVDMTKSAVSHQLRILRQAKLVKARKEGKEVFYSLDDMHVSQIFECALQHIQE